MVKGEVRFIPEETIERLNKMVLAINSGNFNNKVVIL